MYFLVSLTNISRDLEIVPQTLVFFWGGSLLALTFCPEGLSPHKHQCTIMASILKRAIWHPQHVNQMINVHIGHFYKKILKVQTSDQKYIILALTTKQYSPQPDTANKIAK